MDSISSLLVSMIIYENGITEFINNSFNNPSYSASTNKSEKLFFKGQTDASIFYKDRGPGGLTIVTNIYPLPIIGGLITAAICSSITPREDKLGCPYPDLMRNPDYKNGYTQKAFEIKKHRVWKCWGISSGCIVIGLLIAVALSY